MVICEKEKRYGKKLFKKNNICASVRIDDDSDDAGESVSK